MGSEPWETMPREGEIATIDDVVERMGGIGAELAPDDGVACFNRLYLRVTEAVREREARQAFESPGFLTQLDVMFANQYFAAFDAVSAGRECPEAWAPLFLHRDQRDIHPLRFALAGMNAHINHDLPIAVVSTCREHDLEPEQDSPHGRDFHLVNLVLRDVEQSIKKSFMGADLSELDDAAGQADDLIALWSLYAARRVAWNQAEFLWTLRGHGDLESAYTRVLARTVGIAGRGFLV